MSERIALRERQKRRTRSCQHRWIIETPHGATSRGLCKRCGSTKRFPNASDDATRRQGAAQLGRWSARRGIARPTEISLPHSGEDVL